MNKELLRYAKRARTFLVCTVALGMLGASATIAQMALLTKVVDQVFLTGKSLDQVGTLLLLLLGAVVLRSGLLWLREVSAQRGAIFVKSELRERLFAHLMRLGPGYTKGERTGELVTTAVEGVESLERRRRFEFQIHGRAMTLLCPDKSTRLVEGEALLIVARDDLLELVSAYGEPLVCARRQKRVHFHPSPRHQREPQLLRLMAQIFAQVFTGDINTPVFVSSHGPDASTRRLVLRALLGNDGTREVRFERMALG